MHANRLMDLGVAIPDICRRIGIDEQTLAQWQKEYDDNVEKRDTGKLPPIHRIHSKRFWLFEIWDEYRETFKALVAHTLIFALLLGLLVLSHIVINHLDYPPERKELFDKIHYAGYVAVLIVFLISFIIKLMAFEYKGMKK
ncbi:MAG: hypothetical protein QOH63_4161 [Acidobacteriota bacterium]|nr:hypothetical protein [Acidobacteriota bacterium]